MLTQHRLCDNCKFVYKIIVSDTLQRVKSQFRFEIHFVLSSLINYNKCIATMAERLKLLQFIQSTYTSIGIYPPQSNQNRRSVNWRKIFMLFSLMQILILSLAFLIFEAKTVIDAGFPFFVVNTELCCTVYYLINMWKMPKILKIIKEFEKCAEESEFWVGLSIHFY